MAATTSKKKQCEYVLVSQFHIITGSTLCVEFPSATGLEPDAVAEMMMPEGVDKFESDWTYFVLNREPRMRVNVFKFSKHDGKFLPFGGKDLELHFTPEACLLLSPDGSELAVLPRVGTKNAVYDEANQMYTLVDNKETLLGFQFSGTPDAASRFKTLQHDYFLPKGSGDVGSFGPSEGKELLPRSPVGTVRGTSWLPTSPSLINGSPSSKEKKRASRKGFVYCVCKNQTKKDPSLELSKRGAVCMALAVCSSYQTVFAFKEVIDLALGEMLEEVRLCLQPFERQERLVKEENRGKAEDAAQRKIVNDARAERLEKQAQVERDIIIPRAKKLYQCIEGIEPLPSNLLAVRAAAGGPHKQLRMKSIVQFDYQSPMDTQLLRLAGAPMPSFEAQLQYGEHTLTASLPLAVLPDELCMYNLPFVDFGFKSDDKKRAKGSDHASASMSEYSHYWDKPLSLLVHYFGKGVVDILNALLAEQRIIFYGDPKQCPASLVCNLTMASILLVCPPLSGFRRRMFPYVGLATRDFLDIKGFIAGTKNPMYKSEPFWDVLCDIDEKRVIINPQLKHETQALGAEEEALASALTTAVRLGEPESKVRCLCRDYVQWLADAAVSEHSTESALQRIRPWLQTKSFHRYRVDWGKRPGVSKTGRALSKDLQRLADEFGPGLPWSSTSLVDKKSISPQPQSHVVSVSAEALPVNLNIDPRVNVSRSIGVLHISEPIKEGIGSSGNLPDNAGFASLMERLSCEMNTLQFIWSLPASQGGLYSIAANGLFHSEKSVREATSTFLANMKNVHEAGLALVMGLNPLLLGAHMAIEREKMA